MIYHISCIIVTVIVFCGFHNNVCSGDCDEKFGTAKFWSTAYITSGIKTWKGTGNPFVNDPCLTYEGLFQGSSWDDSKKGVLESEGGSSDELKVYEEGKDSKINPLCEMEPSASTPHCSSDFLLLGQWCFHISKCGMTYDKAKSYCTDLSHAGNTGRLISDVDCEKKEAVLPLLNNWKDKSGKHCGQCCPGETEYACLNVESGSYIQESSECSSCSCGTKCEQEQTTVVVTTTTQPTTTQPTTGMTTTETTTITATTTQPKTSTPTTASTTTQPTTSTATTASTTTQPTTSITTTQSTVTQPTTTQSTTQPTTTQRTTTHPTTGKTTTQTTTITATTTQPTTSTPTTASTTTQPTTSTATTASTTTQPTTSITTTQSTVTQPTTTQSTTQPTTTQRTTTQPTTGMTTTQTTTITATTTQPTTSTPTTASTTTQPTTSTATTASTTTQPTTSITTTQSTVTQPTTTQSTTQPTTTQRTTTHPTTTEPTTGQPKTTNTTPATTQPTSATTTTTTTTATQQTTTQPTKNQPISQLTTIWTMRTQPTQATTTVTETITTTQSIATATAATDVTIRGTTELSVTTTQTITTTEQIEVAPTEDRFIPTLMSNAEFIAATVVQSLGCSFIVGSLASVVCLLIIFRSTSIESFIIGNQDLAFLLAHILVLTLREPRLHPGMSEELCTMVAILLHYLFLVGYVFILLESVQVLMIAGYIMPDGSLFSKKINMVLGWGVPATIVIPSALVINDEYATDWTCWMDFAKRLPWPMFVPMVLMGCTAMIFVEAAGMMSRGIPPMPNRNRQQLTSALISRGSIPIVLGLAVGSHIMGMCAVYFQIVYMYGVTFIINICNGIAVLVFHTAGDAKIRNFVSRILTKMKQYC